MRQIREDSNKAVAELNISADIIKVKDLNKIMDYGVMMTPVFVILEKRIIFFNIGAYSYFCCLG